MADQEFYIGSLGPYEYDDTDVDTPAAFRTSGEVYVHTTEEVATVSALSSADSTLQSEVESVAVSAASVIVSTHRYLRWMEA